MYINLYIHTSLHPNRKVNELTTRTDFRHGGNAGKINLIVSHTFGQFYPSHFGDAVFSLEAFPLKELEPEMVVGIRSEQPRASKAEIENVPTPEEPGQVDYNLLWQG